MNKEHRFRTDRLILLGLTVIIICVTAVYFTADRLDDYSWPFITNSLLMFFLGITNVLLILTLLYFLFRNLIKVLLERKKKILGSQFKTKMILAFLLLCLIPSGIIFWVAMQIIQSSVEKWFDTPADQLTDFSRQVVDAYYEDAKGRSSVAAERLGKEIERRRLLQDERRQFLKENMENWLQDMQLDVITLYPTGEEPMTAVVPDLSALPGLEDLPEGLLLKAQGGDGFQWVQPLGGGQLVRAGFPVRAPYSREVEGVILAGYFLPRDLTKVMKRISQSAEDYRQNKAQKEPIKKVYISGFALVTLVVIFLFTWIALTLARGITTPILSLIRGTQELAKGNLDYQVKVPTGDEIGTLVESFNLMTKDLKSNKGTIERSNSDLQRSILQLEERRRYIETLLESVATGVISLNQEGRVTTINREALRILGIPKQTNLIGLHQGELFSRPEFEEVTHFMEALQGSSVVSLQKSFELTFDGKPMHLAVSASSLRDGRDRHLGHLLVLEEMTQLVRAQKVAAWREVAQRLAHEIKNPLTPIQLSAQRIQKKHADGAEDFDESVREGTEAIIREVTSLKRLVDEFSRYARLPPPSPEPTDIGGIIESTLSLYNGRLRGEISLETDLKKNLPLISVDREQMKRVFVNLIDNAIQAIGKRGKIFVRSSFLSDRNAIRVEVADDGPGIPIEDRKKLFLPYFSTKKEGTGLGLAIVQRIIMDHNGTIRAEENHPRGTCLVMILPV